MLRWLELENGEKDENLDQRKTVQAKINKIVNSIEKLENLKTIAQSRSMGIWRIKRAKIILGTLAGKTVEKMRIIVNLQFTVNWKSHLLFTRIGGLQLYKDYKY